MGGLVGAMPLFDSKYNAFGEARLFEACRWIWRDAVHSVLEQQPGASASFVFRWCLWWPGFVLYMVLIVGSMTLGLGLLFALATFLWTAIALLILAPAIILVATL